MSFSLVAGAVAALLAFTLTAALLRDRREMVMVAVATSRIPAGATITPEMIEPAELAAATGFSDSLVAFDRAESGVLVAARTVQPGEPLTDSAVGDVASTAGKRVMSIPLESWQAANGEIQVGDLVDVIETGRDSTRYVLLGAAVVGRSGGDGAGGLVGSSRRGDLVITVEVDSDEALVLAAAIDAGGITVVRSTGATPVPEPPGEVSATEVPASPDADALTPAAGAEAAAQPTGGG